MHPRSPAALWLWLCLLLIGFPVVAAEIHEAASGNDTARLTELLDKYPALLEVKDNSGRTPLHEAARSGSMDTLKLLLERNADVNATDNAGQTPLRLATGFGKTKAVEALKKAGGRQQDPAGITETPRPRPAPRPRNALTNSPQFTGAPPPGGGTNAAGNARNRRNGRNAAAPVIPDIPQKPVDWSSPDINAALTLPAGWIQLPADSANLGRKSKNKQQIHLIAAKADLAAMMDPGKAKFVMVITEPVESPKVASRRFVEKYVTKPDEDDPSSAMELISFSEIELGGIPGGEVFAKGKTQGTALEFMLRILIADGRVYTVAVGKASGVKDDAELMDLLKNFRFINPPTPPGFFDKLDISMTFRSIKFIIFLGVLVISGIGAIVAKVTKKKA